MVNEETWSVDENGYRLDSKENVAAFSDRNPDEIDVTELWFV